MKKYRTHNCSELTISNLNQEIILSGWIDTIRDHGNLIFIDLRDNFGITQCVIDAKNKIFNEISKLSNESIIKIVGNVIQRSDETINKTIADTLKSILVYDITGVVFRIIDPKRNKPPRNIAETIAIIFPRAAPPTFSISLI